MSEDKNTQYKKLVMQTLSDLYNGLAKENEHGRYNEIENKILSIYKKIEHGAYAVPYLNELVNDLRNESLKNLSLHTPNPKILGDINPKLINLLQGPASGLWLSDYARIYGNFM